MLNIHIFISQNLVLKTLMNLSTGYNNKIIEEVMYLTNLKSSHTKILTLTIKQKE